MKTLKDKIKNGVIEPSGLYYLEVEDVKQKIKDLRNSFSDRTMHSKRFIDMQIDKTMGVWEEWMKQ